MNIPVPSIAVWVVIVVELIGGILLLIGFQTRLVAVVLAIFCLITGFAIHLPVGDLPNMINFYKNLVMTGGFLYVISYGAGNLSVDGPSK